MSMLGFDPSEIEEQITGAVTAVLAGVKSAMRTMVNDDEFTALRAEFCAKSYTAFIAAGFNTTDAMELTKISLTSANNSISFK